jgi:hypothetical protein
MKTGKLKVSTPRKRVPISKAKRPNSYLIETALRTVFVFLAAIREPN